VAFAAALYLRFGLVDRRACGADGSGGAVVASDARTAAPGRSRAAVTTSTVRSGLSGC
jgi:hypothetical protein